jgi:hypothetical protein
MNGMQASNRLGSGHEGVLLFLHIPKTGGSTLSNYLYQHPGFLIGSESSPTTSDKYFNYGIYHYPAGFCKDPSCYVAEQREHIANLSGLKAVIGHFSYGIHEAIPGRYRYVTMLRHPVRRVLSLYSHLRLDALHGWVDLATFVSECPPDGWSKRLSARYRCAPRHGEQIIRERSRAIVDNDQVRRTTGEDPPFGECTPDMLERAKAIVRDRFALVGTTERYVESLLLMSRGLSPYEVPLVLPRLVNPSRPAEEAIPTAVRDVIEARNSLDLELYRFADELLSERTLAAGPMFERDLETARATNERLLRENEDIVDSFALASRRAIDQKP